MMQLVVRFDGERYSVGVYSVHPRALEALAGAVLAFALASGADFGRLLEIAEHSDVSDVVQTSPPTQEPM